MASRKIGELLVFSTLHTNDAISSIIRLKNMANRLMGREAAS